MVMPKVLIVGDSHVYAIRSAVKTIGGHQQGYDFSALRLANEKNGEKIGDIDMEELLDTVAGMTDGDAVVTTLRGNQYNTIGLMQHPHAFDVVVPGFESLPVDSVSELIPYETMRFFMADSLKRGYGKLLLKIRKASAVPVFCLSVPAPKEDSAHIVAGAETYFRNAGIADIGVSPASLRLKLWEFQYTALSEFCAQHDISFLPNPDGTRDAGGYLHSKYYARDATHANPQYGALVVNQIADALGER